MLKSPWMLLVVVPGGFLLLAAVAAFGPAESVAAAQVFAGLAALAFVTSGILTFTFARRPSTPALAKLRSFARDWVKAHPEAPEAEVRAVLARRFAGSTGLPNWDDTAGPVPAGGNPGDALAGAGIVALMIWLRHRFFPIAKARPEDIEAVLGELRGEGMFARNC